MVRRQALRLPKDTYFIGEEVYIKTGIWQGCLCVVDRIGHGFYYVSLLYEDGHVRPMLQERINLSRKPVIGGLNRELY